MYELGLNFYLREHLEVALFIRSRFSQWNLSKLWDQPLIVPFIERLYPLSKGCSKCPLSEVPSCSHLNSKMADSHEVVLQLLDVLLSLEAEEVQVVAEYLLDVGGDLQQVREQLDYLQTTQGGDGGGGGGEEDCPLKPASFQLEGRTCLLYGPITGLFMDPNYPIKRPIYPLYRPSLPTLRTHFTFAHFKSHTFLFYGIISHFTDSLPTYGVTFPLDGLTYPLTHYTDPAYPRYAPTLFYMYPL